jgi:hypothetical protein
MPTLGSFPTDNNIVCLKNASVDGSGLHLNSPLNGRVPWAQWTLPTSFGAGDTITVSGDVSGLRMRAFFVVGGTPSPNPIMADGPFSFTWQPANAGNIVDIKGLSGTTADFSAITVTSP